MSYKTKSKLKVTDPNEPPTKKKISFSNLFKSKDLKKDVYDGRSKEELLKAYKSKVSSYADLKGPQEFYDVKDGNKVKKIISPGTPGVGGYKEIGQGKFKKSQEAKETDAYKKGLKLKEHRKQKLKAGAKEAGEIALDAIAPVVPFLGKRRTFNVGAGGAYSNWRPGTAAAAGSDGGGDTYNKHGRMTLRKWHKFKKQNYSTEQRKYNTVAHIRNKGIIGGATGLMTFGGGSDHGDKNQARVKKAYKFMATKAKDIISKIN